MMSDPFYYAYSPPESSLAFEETDPCHDFPTPPPEKERQKSQLEYARNQFLRALPGEREKPVFEEKKNDYVYQPTDPDLLAPYGIVLEGCDCCKFQLNEYQKFEDVEEVKRNEEICGSSMKVTGRKRKKQFIVGEGHIETIQEQIARGAKTQADPKEIDEFVTRIMQQAEIVAVMEGPRPKKPRGRPKGAKSKPKVRLASDIEVTSSKREDRKGCVPYGIIAGLAIWNARKAIPSKEIYRFAEHYFPDCVVGTYWKNSIRHILCTQDYFVKDRPDIGTSYSFNWNIVPEKMRRFWSSVEEFRRTYPNEETYGMTDHSQWPRLIKGELGLLPTNVDADLCDYPKNINIKSEPIDVDYGETENSRDAPETDEAPKEKTIRIKQKPEKSSTIPEVLNKPSGSQPPPNDLQSIPQFSQETSENPSSAVPGPAFSPSASHPALNSHPPMPGLSSQHNSFQSPPLGQSQFAPPPFPGPYYRFPPPGQQRSPPFMPPPRGMWPHPPYNMPGYPPGHAQQQFYPSFNPATNSTPNMSAQWYSDQRLSPKDIEAESKSILLELLTNDANKDSNFPVENTCPREEMPTEQREIPWHLNDHDYCRQSRLQYPPG